MTMKLISLVRQLARKTLLLTLGLALSTVRPSQAVKPRSKSTKANAKESQLDRILAELDAADRSLEEDPPEQQSKQKRVKANSTSRAAPTLDDFLPDVNDLPPVIVAEKRPAEVDQLNLPQLGSEQDTFGFDMPSDDAFAFDADAAPPSAEPEYTTLDSSPLRAYSPVKQKKRLLSLSPAPRRPGSKKQKIIASSELHNEPYIDYPMPAYSDSGYQPVEDFADAMQIDHQPQKSGNGSEQALFQPASSQTAADDQANEGNGVVEEEAEEEDVNDFLTWLENNVIVTDG